jgi:predicted SnoaL-like aldol condensation-catalyzing enzyme
MIGLAIGVAAVMAAPAAERCEPSAAANHRLVEDFYTQALVDKQPREAFARFVAPDFVEHKPDIAPGTREAAAQFLGDLIRDVPAAGWEIVRVIAEGDLVALHARFTPAPGAPEYAIADFFR